MTPGKEASRSLRNEQCKSLQQKEKPSYKGMSQIYDPHRHPEWVSKKKWGHTGSFLLDLLLLRRSTT